MKNLKTILFTVTTLLLFNSNLFAQKDRSSGGNCVQQGTILIDAFYGFPYWNGTILKSEYSGTSYDNTAVRNYNHVGGKVEFMINDHIGIGLEGTFARATVNYQRSNLKYYTGGIDKLRILGKFNFHFATSANFDPYCTAGIGYKNTKVYDNEPGPEPDLGLNIVPVAFRMGVGVRYFFSDAIGINAEVGLGGPLMQAGLSLKF